MRLYSIVKELRDVTVPVPLKFAIIGGLQSLLKIHLEGSAVWFHPFYPGSVDICTHMSQESVKRLI